MPLYEYQCQKCGHVEEKLMKYDDPAPVCILALETDRKGLLERCDGETKRLVSKSSFALKGACWEKDGYANKETKKDSS